MAEEIREGKIVTLTTDELAELVAQAAQQAVKTKGLSNAAAYAAVRSIGNVSNVTETLGLPLPENNETLAYQDFINSANLIIDNFAKTTNNTLDSVSATAASAASGVTAADNKITDITTRLNNDQVDSLPQFKQDTEDRLESVENDVMGLSGWSRPFINKTGSTSNILVSSVGVYRNNDHTSSEGWETITIPVKGWIGMAVTTTYKVKITLGLSNKNLFNLPEINTYYVIGDYANDITASTIRAVGLAVTWNGVSTEISLLSSVGDEMLINQLFAPFTKDGPVA